MRKSLLSALGLAVALAFSMPIVGASSANAAETAKHVMHKKHHHRAHHRKHHRKHHARKHHRHHYAAAGPRRRPTVR